MNDFNINTCSLNGINLIEASAGTGKTHNISRLFLRLFLEKGFNLEEILVVTFTEAATEELRSRIRIELTNAIKDPENKKFITRLEYALTNFDEASVFTIHGFCRKILKENAFESSGLFETELITDQDIILSDIIDDFFRILLAEESSFFLEYIYKNKITSDYFFFLIKNNISKPFLNIIPELDYRNTKKLETKYKNIFTELSDIWKDSKNDIYNLLNSDSLKKNLYSDKIINNVFRNTDILFDSQNDIRINLFDKFNKLTLETLNKAVKKGFKCPSHLFFNKCTELFECNNNLIELYSLDLLFYQHKVFKYTKNKLNIIKKKKNIQFFDDLLFNVYKALNGSSILVRSINKSYKAALIDEFQDTDPMQYYIFKNIFKDSILFLIGDPKQAIYSFRGADIYAYLSALKEENTKKYTLTENWRSEEKLITAVNTIFSRRKNPFLLDAVNFFKTVKAFQSNVEKLTYNGKDCSALNISVLDNSDKDKISVEQAVKISIKLTVNEILKILTENKLKIGTTNIIPEDIAVLVRKNSHAAIIKKELNKAGIPAVLYSTLNLFESDEALQFYRILEAASDPASERKIFSALSTSFYAYTGNQLFDCLHDRKSIDEFYLIFYNLKTLWTSGSFIKMVTYWVDTYNIKANLLRFENGERKLTNLLHLIEVLHNIDIKNQLSIDGILQWFSTAITEPEKHTEHQIRLETDDYAVKIVTIHKAKGLQYPIVFCPFLWYAPTKSKDIIFHDAKGKLSLDLQKEVQNRLLFESEQLAESLRLTYVAVTRARNSCYIITGKINGSENSGLSYLLYPSNETRTSDLELMNYRDIISRIKKLEEDSGGAVRYLPEDISIYRKYKANTAKQYDLELKKADLPEKHDFRITSFSSITHTSHKNYETKLASDFGTDYDSNIVNYLSETKTDEITIHTLPKGAKTGLLVHSIFEDIDFADTGNAEIEKLTEKHFISYGFDKKWIPAVVSMVKMVLNKPLGKEQVRFSSIIKTDIVKEMEFLFPLKAIEKKDFLDCFKKLNSPIENGDNTYTDFKNIIYNKLDELVINPVEGYVKGFIDLVFKYDNKYYITDWKTNYLGQSYEDYDQANIKNMLSEEYYFLQYYLYTLALHKYLTVKIKDYSYKDNFGGIFYIFTRGINNENNNGIFFDIPDIEIINRLNRSLTGY